MLSSLHTNAIKGVPIVRALAGLVAYLLLVYVLYFICRVVYIAEFWDVYSNGWKVLDKWQVFVGGLRFDTAAICYSNILLGFLLLLPLPRKWGGSAWYRILFRFFFVAVNSIMLWVNLADTVYSRYTGRRTTWTFFSEFASEGNLGSIFFVEVLRHWYLLLIGLLFLALLWRGSRMLVCGNGPGSRQPVANAWVRTGLFLRDVLLAVVFVVLCVGGIRGGFSTAVRPIAASNANQYVNEPSQAAMVLNTPFTMIRTCGKTTFSDPHYFSPEELDAIYSAIHLPRASAMIDTKPNIVILIMESLGQEYIGFYNDYRGYTPFLDSLIGQSLTYRQSYSNGHKSIDGMPSVLSSIPMFVEPFFVTHYSLNDVSSIAGELSSMGYTSAFFHGAENGSMGFQAYSRASGFDYYYGRNEYNADARFGRNADFDGTWAVWDEEFLQYFALMMDTLPQPFCTALFSATSHHPFVVPERYRQSLHQPGHPMYTCIRYVDQALQKFFAAASRMPWYENTVFVITADHTNHTEQPAYAGALGTFRVPIIIFDPSHRLPVGVSGAIAQQIDIMPTLLGMVGYPNPYVAFGIDLLDTPAANTWAVNYNNGIYQFVTPRDTTFFDGHRILSGSSQVAQTAEADSPQKLKAIIQCYIQRMISNNLTYQPYED